MRLLDVRTRKLLDEGGIRRREAAEGRDYDTTVGVPYAILSHRWFNDEDEVSFIDIQNDEIARSKPGYEKIDKFCKIAEADGHKYGWIDTCCIDKSSSAELQEAINSMYTWYHEAEVCYAHLRAVRLNAAFRRNRRMIRHDQWFTRGWTLQELIAPRRLVFLDRKWESLGDRSFLLRELHDITGINAQVLSGEMHVRSCCVAERMSWAAKRRTKRVEDQAYSLFGIFEINLPMLYGEGARAFGRLQEEIIRTSDDPTIFAWNGLGPKFSGLLAGDVKAFANASDMRRRRSGREGQLSYSLSNRGVAVNCCLLQWTIDIYLVYLGCWRKNSRWRGDPDDTGHQLTCYFLQKVARNGPLVRVAVDGQDDKTFSVEQFSQLMEANEKHFGFNNIDVAAGLRNMFFEWEHHLVGQTSVLRQTIGFRVARSFHDVEEIRMPLAAWLGMDSAVNQDSAQAAQPQTQNYVIELASERLLGQQLRSGGSVAVFHPKAGSTIPFEEIRLGFNYAFEPVIILMDAIPDHLSSPKKLPKDCRRVSDVDMHLTTTDDKKLIVQKRREPFWTLTADWLSGLDVYLGSPDGIRVVMKRVADGDSALWDFDLILPQVKPLEVIEIADD